MAVIATNEPFWQANIGAQTLALTGFRASAQVLRVVSMRDDRAGRHWVARGDGGGEVEASVAPIACLDSLSGEALPYLATLRIGHVTAGGCARAADTGGDAEIPAAFTGRWAPDPLACAEPGRDPDGLVIGTRSIALRGETATPSAIAVPTLSRITMTIEQGGRALDLVLLLDASGRHLTMTGAGPALNRLRCQDP